MKKYTLILLLFIGCTTAPEFIPEPPLPSEIHYDAIKSVHWQSNKQVVYNYSCSAGDANAIVTLRYVNDEWTVANWKWGSKICPLR